MDQWTNGPMDQWTNGPLEQSTNDPMVQWTHGPHFNAMLCSNLQIGWDWDGIYYECLPYGLLIFDIQPMDQWTNGPMVQWSNGPMDQWTNTESDGNSRSREFP